MNCLAIDDEPLALALINDYIARIPLLKMHGSFTNALEASKIIQDKQIDLIFLDIQMPNITGVEFIQSLVDMPMVIFTTAYNQYALKGYELNVLDYLLKPFSFERFQRAVNKAHNQFVLVQKAAQSKLADEKKFILVKAEYETLRIEVDQIWYIEALGDYIRVFTQDKSYIAHSTMKKILEQLPEADFMRVHKSYIAGLNHISSYNKNKVVIGKKIIPLGDSYKEQLLNKIVKSGK